MKARPRLKEIDAGAFEAEIRAITTESISVKVRDLFPGALLPCDIYYPGLVGMNRTIALTRLLARNEIYEEDYHNYLLGEGIYEVFIKAGDENSFLDYFDRNVRRIVNSSDALPEKKTQLLYDNAENVIKKVFRERPSRSNIMMGRQLIENFAVHLALDKVTAEALLSIFSKDYFTFSHCVHVALLGMSFCRFLGWGDDEVIDFGLGALFHDIGKSAIDEQILNKPAKLDKEEFETIKKHPLLGYHQLKNAQLISKPQMVVVLYHHEARDGSGYPQGLKGRQIHKNARIARIIDCYDALTTRRPYKEALSVSEAVQMMNSEMRHTYDVQFLDAFIDYLGLEQKMRETAQARRVNVELGTQIMIQFEEGGVRLKTLLVGMEPGEYLILRIPGMAQIQRQLDETATIIARYVHAGVVYGFRTAILSLITRPFRFLILDYPRAIENLNLRGSPRIECFLPVEAVIGGTTYLGVVTDISIGGCKAVLKQSDTRSLPPILQDDKIILCTQLLGENKRDSLPGRVRSVRIEDNKSILGVQFMDLGPEALEDLDRCIGNVLLLVG